MTAGVVLKKITFRNFQSFGDAEQEVLLDIDPITLIIGENSDMEGEGARNGSGKTSLAQSICFALFGKPLSNVKFDNLVNATNNKNLVVSLEFTRNDVLYRIERGRKPAYLKWFENYKDANSLQVKPPGGDEQGENKWTQKEIEKRFGLNYDLFGHLVGLNTSTVPFMRLGAASQRMIIENLLGIDILGQKADVLRKQMQILRESIRDEEVRIKSVKENNEKTAITIRQLELKSNAWEADKNLKLGSLMGEIDKLEHIDIEFEIEQHRLNETTLLLRSAQKAKTDFNNQEIKNIEYKIKSVDQQILSNKSQISMIHARFTDLQNNIVQLESGNCHACGQEVSGHTHEQLLNDMAKKIEALTNEEETLTAKNTNLEIDKNVHKSELVVCLDHQAAIREEFANISDIVSTFYKNKDEAAHHKTTLQNKINDLITLNNSVNTYIDQVTLVSQNISNVSYDTINNLQLLLNHQDTLLDILTKKNSFIRKKIVSQNLNYLNTRLAHYLRALNLTQHVKFLDNLEFEITELGREFDFEQLSSGERNRLILALNWSFRDTWESMNCPINFLFVDEVIDQNMDTLGVEGALSILKDMGRNRAKNIFLVSHKEELMNRFDNILYIQRKNGFSKIVDIPV